MARWALSLLLVFVFLGTASRASADDGIGGLVDILVDGGNNYDWQKVELSGTSCGNGSQYKFFVHRTSSRNVLFLFEGGGACWDYDTCSGRAGVLGAANPNGIADDYMTQFQAKYVSPLVNGADPGLPFRSRTDLPTKDWNIVFLPYCTGDVHIGNTVAVYRDPQGIEPPLAWIHSGYDNTRAVINYARETFAAVDKLLVTGFSAGGTATSSAYWFVRQAFPEAHGYLLNDSGPIYSAATAANPSRSLHEKIRSAWQLDNVFSLLPANFDREDLGTINSVVAEAYPQDQIAYTAFSRDYDYSRFSYERFLSPNDKESVLAYWKADEDRLLQDLARFPNVSWFVPWQRPINKSHCTTIITFVGSHACADMEKKRNWYEYLEYPWGQTWKCYSEFVPMETFLGRFLDGNQRTRIQEPENGYNDDDPGMKILAPIISAALGG